MRQRSRFHPSGLPSLARLAALGLACAAVLGGCRKGDPLAGTSGTAIVPNGSGANGCNGAAVPFVAGQAPLVIATAALTVGANTALAAARDAEVLYATGGDGAVVALDFSTGDPPVETVLVSPGIVDLVLIALGITTPARLSSLAVLDGTTLLVVEETSNAILAVDRTQLDAVTLFAGFPSETPGQTDGPALLSRFSLSSGAQLCPTGDGRVFVADAGNHALRMIQGGLVVTVAGSGIPASIDGDLSIASFDLPTGVVVGCGDELIVTERGGAGVGGHRLRAVAIGAQNFFGSFDGSTRTLAGDGTADTVAGIGPLASLAGPFSPVVTAAGEAYWIDGLTGVVRRFDLVTGAVDCPLAVDCSAAVASPVLTPGGEHSLVVSASGALYATDGSAGTLLRLVP